MADDKKKPAGADIDDLKARLGLKKPGEGQPAAPAPPGMGGPPGVAPGGAPPPAFMQQPQKPADVTKDPFAPQLGTEVQRPSLVGETRPSMETVSAEDQKAAGKRNALITAVVAILLPWLARWRERLAGEHTTATERQAQMYAANPALIPRNHLVEEALQAALYSVLSELEDKHELVELVELPIGLTMSYGQMSEIFFMLVMPLFKMRMFCWSVPERTGVPVAPVQSILRHRALSRVMLTVWPAAVKELASKKTLSSIHSRRLSARA